MNNTNDLWTNKVAVVTGGASGIGRAIVENALSKGMKVVIADINAKALEDFVNDLGVDKSRILAVQTDVAKFESVQNLANLSFETFGQVDFLFNNAGVADNTFLWESTLKDWDWVLGVNLMGIVYGIKAFIPKMLDQGREGFIINTASNAGLVSTNLGIYSVSKHAAVALSETLQLELMLINSKLRVAVFCPYFIKSNINSSEKNRPRDLINKEEDNSINIVHPELAIIKKFADRLNASGLDPKVAVEILFKEIAEGKFYILTQKDEWNMKAIRIRMEEIMEGSFKGQFNLFIKRVTE